MTYLYRHIYIDMSIRLFDNKQWIEDKKLEIVKLLFSQEFGIDDFRDSGKIINFDDLQTEEMKLRIASYRPALGCVFASDDVRSTMDYYYMNQDKKPVLNLLKQLLAYYGYKFRRYSEYQGNYDGKKIYKSRYIIVRNNGAEEETEKDSGDQVDDKDEGETGTKVKARERAATEIQKKKYTIKLKTT